MVSLQPPGLATEADISFLRYIPAPSLLGWHIGLWNLIGAIGFTLCGALGFADDDGGPIEYALTLSTFVGSWAFLVSFFGLGL